MKSKIRVVVIVVVVVKRMVVVIVNTEMNYLLGMIMVSVMLMNHQDTRLVADLYSLSALILMLMIRVLTIGRIEFYC